MGWSCLGGVAASAFLASAPIEAVGLANLGNQILIASTILVIVAALVLAAIGRRQLGVVSTGMGAVFEHVYEFVNDMASSFMGERGERYTPFAMSIFLFVLLCNWSGLLPARREPVCSCLVTKKTTKISPIETAATMPKHTGNTGNERSLKAPYTPPITTSHGKKNCVLRNAPSIFPQELFNSLSIKD